MARRRNGLPQRKTGLREYRDVCWVSTEVTTERDYLQREGYKGSATAVQIPHTVLPTRQNPPSRAAKPLRRQRLRLCWNGKRGTRVITLP